VSRVDALLLCDLALKLFKAFGSNDSSPPQSTPLFTPSSFSMVEMAYQALSMILMCNRRCESRQSDSPDVQRSAGCTGCNGALTAACSLVLLTHERGPPGGGEAAGWDRDGRGRMTVLAFCMTPPWGAPLARSRMVNGSEKERHAQAIMRVWKRQADCGGDQRAKIKTKLKTRRYGHVNTISPAAAGLLPLPTALDSGVEFFAQPVGTYAALSKTPHASADGLMLVFQHPAKPCAQAGDG
jgi:hypothetical protein